MCAAAGVSMVKEERRSRLGYSVAALSTTSVRLAFVAHLTRELTGNPARVGDAVDSWPPQHGQDAASASGRAASR